MKMKVCIMNFVYNGTTYGGSGVYCKTIAKALKERGHEVFVITTKPYKNLESLKVSTIIIDGIKVYEIWPLLLNMPLYSKKISNIGRVFTFLLDFFNPYVYYNVKKILKKENPDVIHTNDVMVYLSLSVFRAANSLNIPVVHTLHYYSLIHPIGNLLNLNRDPCKYPSIWNKIFTKINDFIIGDGPKIVTSVSKFCLNKHHEYGIFLDKKCVVIPNLFYININKKSNKNKEQIKKYFDILYVGNLSTHKGVHTLIKAFKKMQDTNARLHIVGDGIEIETNFLKKIAKNDNRIIFYGRIQNDKIEEFYEMADVSVVPSQMYETFGRVVIESFMAGTPVIGSNIGAIPELIQNDFNGFLFEPANVDQLKEILEYLIINKEKLKKMRENCINNSKEYSIENNIYKLEEIYKEAITLNKK